MAKPRYKSDRKIGGRGSERIANKSNTAPKVREKTHVGPKAHEKNKVSPKVRDIDKQAKPATVAKSEPGQKQDFAKQQLPNRVRREGERLPETTGMVLESQPTENYAVIDSGNGQKLERYGPLIIARPEGQAIWLPTEPESVWQNADAIFTGDTDEEGQGRWRYPKGDLPETWPLEFDGMPFYGRFTSFRHTGVFPEQAAHWLSLQLAIKSASLGRPVRMLNLFGYTGLASLVGARAGAEVTHVDASKRAIGWARENQELAGLTDKPIRWICDDAMKFCAREVRRGHSYDVILLDPPAYGRGPKGEVWQLFENLPHMLDMVRDLQSDRPLMTVLTAYAIRASHFAIHEIMQEVFAGMTGRLESGELILRQESGGRAISTSMFSRYISKECTI